MRGDPTALDPEQLRGMERFQSAGCINCHSGPMFSDFASHVLGVPDNARLAASDDGVNKSYAFRTPSLRNLAVTGPYMHNGAFASLQDVVNFYQRISGGGGRRGGRGGWEPERAGRSGSDRPPRPRAEHARPRTAATSIAFLRALDDPGFDRTIPARVPSGLPVGGRLQP